MSPKSAAQPLSPAEVALIDAWWRAANYLSVGQIYLLDNPLLARPLELPHIKPRLLGHWGTTPGLNFIYVHLNRAIKAHDLDLIAIAGPGHGGPGMVANAWLEGTYSEVYPGIPQNAEGMCRLFRQFSFPGGIPSHCAPETPGSIHEGGELGYALSHAYGASLRPIASLNYLLTSHVWRQDHNGFSHQDPGFIDHVVNKKADVIRVYLPPDANTLLYVADHCLRSWNRINVIVAGKQSAPQWLGIDAAVKHCTAGIGIWEWASNDRGIEPDVVMACAGDVPTLEVLAAVDFLRRHLPDLKIRVVNVVDLMTLQPHEEHPHGLADREFDTLFTTDKPIVFAYHGYPWLIHRLTYRRTNHRNLHVRGYKEEGTTTTPFDMVVRNDLDRYHLAGDVIDRVPKLGYLAAYAKQAIRDKLIEHKAYITRHGDDMPEVKEWRWPGSGEGRHAGISDP